MANLKDSNKKKIKKAFLKIFSVFLAFQIPATYSIVSVAAENYNNTEKIDPKVLLINLKSLNISKKNNRNNSKFYSFFVGLGVGSLGAAALSSYNTKKFNMKKLNIFNKEKFEIFLLSLEKLISTKFQSPKWHENTQEVYNVVLQSNLGDEDLNKISGLLKTICEIQEENSDLRNKNENLNLELGHLHEEISKFNLEYEKKFSEDICKVYYKEYKKIFEESKEYKMVIEQQGLVLLNQEKQIEDLRKQISSLNDENKKLKQEILTSKEKNKE
jgi:cell division protein FtsB